MLCTLVFVGYAHLFEQGRGNVLRQKCYYDCGQGAAYGSWYDRV